MTGEKVEQKKGVINKYIEDKRFGFLQNGVFFHINGVKEELRPHIRPGLEVNYVETQGEKALLPQLLLRMMIWRKYRNSMEITQLLT